MSAEPFFLDTSGWLAILNSSDRLNITATPLWHELIVRQRRPIYLTTWIIAETGNGLARTPARKQFAAAVELLEKSTQARIVTVDDDLLKRALELYEDRPDKTYGLIDCASFLVMEDHQIHDAFTSDRHFEQAGFRCLLPP